ncbi:MAG: Imm1 family immunity protein [Planctomycetes bacterium]|nr:Imm1 family immunity protein [Planctomycetota bacterium]
MSVEGGLFWRDQRLPVGDERELRALLLRIETTLEREGRTGLAQLGRPPGGMWIGLGRAVTVLCYEPLDRTAPGAAYALSRGDDPGAAGEVEFELANQVSCFPVGAVIPLELGKRVLTDFLATGALSTRIAWSTTPCAPPTG